jgi:peroxiredoxin
MIAFVTAVALASAPLTVVNRAQAVTDAVAAGRGKIVVLKFWATWCGPCVEEFDDVLKTLAEFSPKDVLVVSVSADDKDAITRYVQPFLDKHKMPYATLLLDQVDSAALIASVDKTWDGTLPAVFIYDRQGKLAKRILGPSAKPLKHALGALLKP